MKRRLACATLAGLWAAFACAADAPPTVIGEIRLYIGDVFETDKPEENKSFFRLANKLHINTRADVIRQQLLFKSGDVYQERLLRETERILRSNRYLFDAAITAVPAGEGVVDVEVRTRDVWTFKPGILYSRQGGANATGFELQESNLFGYGKEITVARRKNVDRSTSEYRYYDPHVLGSWYRAFGSYAQNSDGTRTQLWADRPFYSLDTRWSAIATVLDWERIDSRYDLGQIIDSFAHRQERYDIGAGWSPGWKPGWLPRFNVGMVYARDTFGRSTAQGFAPPPGRTFAYPFVGVTLLQDAFEERRNQNQIERTEDLYAGDYLQASVGYASHSTGADRVAWLMNVSGATTFETMDRSHTLQLNANLSGRVEDGDVENGVVNMAATYYWRVAPRQLFYAAISGTASERLDEDRQIMLGGDTGLRGYPLRYQDGSARALLTLEHRLYTPYYLFRLFHVGGAVFFDAGKTFGTGNAQLSPTTFPIETKQGLLRNVGLGLRFGSSRSAFGNVIHVDVAFPLDGDSTIKDAQFVVESKASF